MEYLLVSAILLWCVGIARNRAQDQKRLRACEDLWSPRSSTRRSTPRPAEARIQPTEFECKGEIANLEAYLRLTGDYNPSGFTTITTPLVVTVMLYQFITEEGNKPNVRIYCAPDGTIVLWAPYNPRYRQEWAKSFIDRLFGDDAPPP